MRLKHLLLVLGLAILALVLLGIAIRPATASNIVQSAYQIIQDEGTSLTRRNTLDCVGAGVTCTDAGGKTVLTVPAGGGGTVTQLDTGCGLAGGPITTTGTVISSQTVNAQSMTTYTFQNSDCGKLVTQSNSMSIADTLPQAGSGGNFISGWWVSVQNTGVGTVTITPTTSTIDGAASLALTTNQGVVIFSNGTNYFTQRGGAATTTIQKGQVTLVVGSGDISSTGTKACSVAENAFTITKAELIANAVPTGNDLIVDVLKVAFGSYTGFASAASITSATPPTITTAAGNPRYTDSTLSMWTVAISAGDVICVNIKTAAPTGGSTYAALSLKYTIP